MRPSATGPGYGIWPGPGKSSAGPAGPQQEAGANGPPAGPQAPLAANGSGGAAAEQQHAPGQPVAQRPAARPMVQPRPGFGAPQRPQLGQPGGVPFAATTQPGPQQQRPAGSGHVIQQAPRPSVPFGGGPPTPGGAAPAVASAPRPNANGPGFGGGLGGGFGAAQRPQQPARPTSPGSQALAQRPLGGGGLQRPLGGGLGGELQRPPMQPPAAGPGSSSMSQQRAQQQQLSQQQQPTASGPRSASGGGSIQAGGMQGLSAALPGSSSRLPSQAGPPQPPMLGRTGPPAPPLAAQPGMGGQHAHGFPPGPGGGMQPPRHMQPPNGMPHPSGPLPPPGMRPPGGSRPPSFGRPPPQFGQPQRTQQQQPQRGPPGLLPSTPPFPGATAGVSPLVISPSAQSAASPTAVPPGHLQLRSGSRGSSRGVIRSGGNGPRVDPRQMPRPASSRGAPAAVFETRQQGKHAIPPPSSDDFAVGRGDILVRDYGNASPRNMRLTLNYIPCSADLARTAAMPLAVILQPLALPGADDDPLQVVDSGEEGPVRCSRCKAYMNPFVAFVDGGRKFRCNICGHVNHTPEAYFCRLGPDGRRADVYERAELCRGSVEFAATAEYMVQPPMAPTHLFLVDVSYAAIASGATAAVCSAISRTLDHVPGGSRARIGIATFDSQVQFYALGAGQSAPQMLVVPDVWEPYAPSASSLIVNAQQSRALAEQLLEAIPRLFEGSQASEVATGAAISAAVAALEEAGGGKLHVFAAALPKVGAGALKPRQAEGGGGGEPLAIMSPQAPFYTKLAVNAAEHQVCIDVSVLGGGFVDAATLRELCHHTGGQLYHYEGFTPALDADQLWNDLRWNLMRPQGLEAVARLRVSSGLDVDKYGGVFHRRTATDIDLPALNADQALVATLAHDERLKDGEEVYLQFALLYTTTDGHRRIRTHNVGVPVTSVLGTVFRGADLESQLNVHARRAADSAPTTSLTDINKKVHKAVSDTLYVYRRYCAVSANPGQLILPEALKLLPLYALALTKMAAFRPETPHDARAAGLARIDSLPAGRTVPLAYGRLIALHRALAEAGISPSGGEQLAAGGIARGPLPLATVPLSSGNVDAEGVYLLENGSEAWLYFGGQAPPQLVHDLLGEEAALAVLARAGRARLLPRLDTPASYALHATLDSIRQQRSAYLRLRIVKAGDPLEAAFLANLVEDKTASTSSYVKFLCDIHRAIANKSGGR